MFEYKIVAGAIEKKILFNPKYIIAISEDNCNLERCYIYTVNGSYLVRESYETVSEHYNNWLARCG